MRVQEFDNEGHLLSIIDLRAQAKNPYRVAADSAGRVYVTLPFPENKVLVYGPGGADSANGANGAGGAADSANGAFLRAPKNPSGGQCGPVGTRTFLHAPKISSGGQCGPVGTRQFLRALDVPNAKAIAVVKINGQERVVVAPEDRRIVNGAWKQLDGDKLLVLNAAATGVERTIALPAQYNGIEDLSSDDAGNFYLKAQPNAITKFSPSGQWLKTWGGNSDRDGRARAEDGSQVIHTVAVDGKNNVYTLTWGNPGRLTRFDADGKTVTQRDGQFKWADPWSGNSSYVPLAVDPTTGRLWAGATQRYAPDYVHIGIQQPVPAIVRTSADFFDLRLAEGIQPVASTPLYKVGYKAQLGSDLPDNVSYEPNKPVTMNYAIPAAARNVDGVKVKWNVVDENNKLIASGSFDLTLKDGVAADASFSFTPSKFGNFFVTAEAVAPQGSLGAQGSFIAVTPLYAGMKTLAPGERTRTATTDAATQMWAGLANVRLYPFLFEATTPEAKKRALDEFELQLSTAEKNGALILVQLVDRQEKYSADDLRLLMNRFGRRITYLEVVNEPNFSGSADSYFKIHREAYQIVKGISPTTQVIGPATVDIDLYWARRLYELGFKAVSDGYSFHDYEGHESISPEHWVYRIGELRKIMAEFGDGDKPLWQTERAIAGIRGFNLMGKQQAIRLALHLDLMETLGVPAERDLHFYMSQSGFSEVPSYLWSETGPMPGALVARTRYALTAAKGRSFVRKLDFGPQANDLFLGVVFQGRDGAQTVTLRNLGTVDTPLTFGVTGASQVQVTDAYGNSRTVPVADGRVTLTLGQLPIYVELPAGATITAPKLSFGQNIAGRASFAYSGPKLVTKEYFGSDIKTLNNGIIETFHTRNPLGDVGGEKIWTGAMPRDAQGQLMPQTLTMSFDSPQTVQSLVLYGVPADNAFSALLAYDVEYQDAAGAWKTLAQVRNAPPPSVKVATADADTAIFTDDTNFYVNQFAPVLTSRLRVKVLDVTRGFVPDDSVKAWGYEMTPYFQLREVQIFTP